MSIATLIGQPHDENKREWSIHLSTAHSRLVRASIKHGRAEHEYQNRPTAAADFPDYSKALCAVVYHAELALEKAALAYAAARQEFAAAEAAGFPTMPPAAK